METFPAGADPRRPAALVTGGARRVGRAMSVALACRGRDIALHYNGSVDEAQALAEELGALGVRCVPLRADLTRREELLGLLGRALEALPALDLVVNNASVFEPATLAETEPDLFDRAMALHVTAPFFLVRDLARRVGSGHVVNILDTRIAREPIEHFAYTLSKKTLHDLTRLAAAALAPAIRVNAIAPGVILPPPGADEAYMLRREAAIPLRRSGDPEAVVRALEYLLDATFVTGETLFVDGGEHLGFRPA